jgi:hypothetical protein
VEKRKRLETNHWVTPGVFSGHYTVDEAVERITTVKQMETTAHTVDDSAWKERLELLESRVIELTQALAAWENRWKEMEVENKKERQYLYQVVLSLKKEWEKERDEYRHN